MPHHWCRGPRNPPGFLTASCPPAKHPAGSHPTEGHLAADADGSRLLCLLDAAASRLLALRLPPDGGPPEAAFAMDAAAVAAVVATRPSPGPGPHIDQMFCSAC
jgi:hypothetical protein